MVSDVVPPNPEFSGFYYNSLFFLNSQTGYYAKPYGLYKTIDGGVSWNLIKSVSGNFISVLKFPTVNTGYFSSNNIIYKTTDAGNTWVPSSKFKTLITGMSFTDSVTGWASSDGIYHTTK